MGTTTGGSVGGDIVTEADATGAVLRQPITGSIDRIRSVLNDAAADTDGSVLVDDCWTTSVFLERGPTSHLVWYLERPLRAGDEWADPVRTLLTGSRLFDVDGDADGELGAFVAVEGTELLVREPSVHAATPFRPTAVGEAGGTSPEVVLVRLDVASGFPAWTLRRIAGAVDRIDPDGWFGRRMQRQSATVMTEERMCTETLALTDDGETLWWYMEAESMAQVYEAYYGSDAEVARWSEWVLRRVLADPDDILAPPLGTEFELLVHDVAADRA